MVLEKRNVLLICRKGIFVQASPAALHQQAGSWWETQGLPWSLSQGGVWGFCCLRPWRSCR